MPTGAGFANANLRGLGSSGTLVLMNGRKLAAANGGFGADLNTVPMEALGAVSVLKDGASATYGAGAVGGVINFQTRRDVKAPQFNLEHRMYDGSDGYWYGSFVDGFVGDSSNLLVTLSYTYEAPLLQNKRDFANLPFNVNPAQYSLTPANPGVFQASTNFLTGTPTVASSTLNGINDYRTQQDCLDIGGVITNVVQLNSTTIGGCGFSQAPFQDIVSETRSYKAYTEFNGDISDNLAFHFDVSYSKNETFFQQIPFGPPTNRSTDATVAANCTSSCHYVIPTQVNTYTTAATGGLPTATAYRNPFINDFMTRTGTSAAALPDTGALYTALYWRPALFGGTPLFDGENGLRRERYTREQLIFNSGIKGSFANDGMLGFLGGITYDFSGQYSQYKQENQNPDISVARLQSALLGYGGPSCNAVDRVPIDFTSAASFNRTVGIQSDTAPGTAGCQWFNPFASAFTTSIANGAANPQYNAGTPLLLAPGSTPRPGGYQNSKELFDWLVLDKVTEDIYESGTFNLLFSGELPKPLVLPGGPISWAVGSEWRMIERRSTSANDKNLAEEQLGYQECPYPDPAVINSPAQSNQDVGQRGCATASGAFFGSGKLNITTRQPPAYSDEQTIALFAELQIPVLDNLNFQAAFRHEDFNGGDLQGDIWSLAGKYDITDNLYLRASYSTNYRAEAALDIDPNLVTFANTTYTRFGAGFQRIQTTSVGSSISPEDDSTINVGVGWQSELFEGRLRASIDFFEININGQLQTTPSATILNDVFGANTALCQSNRNSKASCDPLNSGLSVTSAPLPAVTTNNIGQLANCGANLVSYVVFTGPCVTGVTTAADVQQINLLQINGPYFVTNGLDYSIDYTHPLFDGTFGAQFTATQNLVYKQGGYSVNGTIFDNGGDRLGFNNLSRTGSSSTEWKGNASLRWANKQHSFNFRVNYDGGALAEAAALGSLVAVVVDNPATTTIETQYSNYGVDPHKNVTYDLTYIYTAPFWKDLELRFTVLNITDEDPSPLQIRSGYYTGTADPRGRMFEVGITKKF